MNKKLTPIIIPCHWHTGSSLISKTLENCGMHTGNKKTFWDDSCLDNCEHYLLSSTIATVVNNEHKDVNQNIEQVRIILENYKNEAENNNWEFYGVKTTHLLQSWDVFGKVFQTCWPDAIYVIGIQHPIQIAKTLASKPHGAKYSKKELYDYVTISWLKACEGIKDILTLKNQIYIIDCPTSWQNNEIKTILNKIGLDYKAGDMFQDDRIYKVDGEKEGFEKDYPEATKAYYDLVKISGNLVKKTDSKSRGKVRSTARID